VIAVHGNTQGCSTLRHGSAFETRGFPMQYVRITTRPCLRHHAAHKADFHIPMGVRAFPSAATYRFKSTKQTSNQIPMLCQDLQSTQHMAPCPVSLPEMGNTRDGLAASCGACCAESVTGPHSTYARLHTASCKRCRTAVMFQWRFPRSSGPTVRKHGAGPLRYLESYETAPRTAGASSAVVLR
jgi:hypothetical protein